jgi:hypothetical protein
MSKLKFTSEFLYGDFCVIGSRGAQVSVCVSGMAAKYLPILVERYRENTGALNSSMTMINVISHTLVSLFIFSCGR